MVEKIYESPAGALILIASGKSLIYCNWDTPDCDRKLKRIAGQYEEDGTNLEKQIISDVTNRLDKYFSGENISFSLPLSKYGTDFQKKVWNAIASIPYGETADYSTIANLIGHPDACRAVAAACGANPWAIIIPCHRVTAKNNPGGYTGGIEKKFFLNSLEKFGNQK